MNPSADADDALPIEAARSNTTVTAAVQTHILSKEKTLNGGGFGINNSIEPQELIGAKAGSAACKTSQSALVSQVRQLQEELSAAKVSQNEMQSQLHTALSENADLQANLKEETELVFELRGRAEQVGHVRDATRELTRQNKALESRIQLLQTALKERQKSENELAKQVAQETDVSQRTLIELEKALNERANALQRAEKAEQEAGKAKEEAHAARIQNAATASEQATAAAWLAEQRGDALRRILSLVDDTPPSQNSDTLDCSSNDNDLGDRALEAVKIFCETFCGAQKSWEEERQDLTTQLENTKTELETLLAARSVEDAAQLSIAISHEEVAGATARATSATLEAAQLQGQLSALQERVADATLKAAAAEEEASELRASAEAREERTREMRAAAAEAVRQNKILCDDVQTAARTAVELVLNSAAALQSPSSDNCDQPADALSALLTDAIYTAADSLEAVATNTANPTKFGHHVALALQTLCQGYSTMVDMVVERQKVHAALSAALCSFKDAEFAESENNNDSDNLMDDSAKGALVSVAATSLHDITNTTTTTSSSSKDSNALSNSSTTTSSIALDSLLEAVLAHLSTLIQKVHAEKEVSESELDHLREAHSGLHSQLQALHRVLQVADRGDALVELAVAQRRVDELEEMCRELAERAHSMQLVAEDAKLAAARDWSDVKADVAQLVQHAERAQLDAETAVQRQRGETAKLVSEARAREHAACGARSEAEGKCSKLREELAGVVHQLQSACADVVRSEQRAAALEERLACVQSKAREHFEMPPLPVVNKEEEDDQAAVQAQRAQTELIVADLQDKLARCHAELDVSNRRAAAAETTAAQHLAVLGAASKQVQQAEAQVAAANNKASSLELTLLSMESQVQAQNITPVGATAAPLSPSMAPSAAAPHPHPLVSPQAPPPFPTMPPSRDASVLQRRLDAAISQIESLRALNRNLEEQLSTAVEAFGGRSQIEQAVPTEPGLSASEVRDAAEREREASQLRLERVVSMWKEACASRDTRLLEVEAKLRTTSTEVTQRTSEIAALQRSSAAATAESEASLRLISDLRSRLDESKLAQEALQNEVQAGKKAEGDDRRAREALASSERQLSNLQNQITAAQIRIASLEGSLEDGRAASAHTAEQLELLKDSEARASAAEERAGAAESALAAHLDPSSASEATSLGKQLENAWAAERDLAQRVQDLRSEAAEARGAAAAAERDAEAQAARCGALQAQLAEAIGALEEQGAALEAFQGALIKARAGQEGATTAAAGGGHSAQDDTSAVALLKQHLSVAEQRVSVLRCRLSSTEEAAALATAERTAAEALLERFKTGAAAVVRTLQHLDAAGSSSGKSSKLFLLDSENAFGSEEAVDALFEAAVQQLHRRDCDVATLVAQVQALEAVAAGKARQAAEQAASLYRDKSLYIRVE